MLFNIALNFTKLSRITLIPVVNCSSNYRLIEVGKFESPKLSEKYETGQLFLHRVFGYRGVILVPWLARVYDRDVPKKKKSKPVEETLNYNQVGKDVKGRAHTYYQVLIDSRDCPYISQRIQPDGVTFLGNQDNGRTIYAVSGLDYIAHEDVMPYVAGDKKPISHVLFDKFLEYHEERDPPFGPRETLKAWQEQNHPWLELSDVYKETTENIRVTVIPFYMGCRESYWWRYCIRLENLGKLTVTLRKRDWQIFSDNGTNERVQGKGVVRQEPVLSPQQPVFQYSSHTSLRSPSGKMWGTFRMEREDGYTFDCRIPPFDLESK